MDPYYDDGMVTIYHGDCRMIDGLGADVVVTDPPYNVGYRYDSYHDRLDETDYRDYLRECFTAATGTSARALVWFWQGIRVANGEVAACLPRGFAMHHLGAWFKREFAGDLWKGGHPAFSWEPIIWTSRGEASYHGPKGGHMGRDCLIEGTSSRHNTLAKGHPCPKTESVVRGVVGWAAEQGDIVLDPFMGSGTTLRAAKDLGIRSIGIEVDERYCEIAAKRMAQGVLALASVQRPPRVTERTDWTEEGT